MVPSQASLEIRDLSSILVNGQAVRAVVAAAAAAQHAAVTVHGPAGIAATLSALTPNPPVQVVTSAGGAATSVPLMIAEGGQHSGAGLGVNPVPVGESPLTPPLSSASPSSSIKAELAELPDSCSFGILVSYGSNAILILLGIRPLTFPYSRIDIIRPTIREI